MNASSEAAQTGKRRGWLFKLGIVAGVLVLLLVVAYFIVTSGAFFKGVILPRVGKAANAQITVSDASISVWSEVDLHGLKVQPNGKETLLEAEQVKARYSLSDIIHGKINVQEVTLNGPVITVVQNADGTSNLDPLKQGQEQKPAAQKEEKKAGAPPQVNIRNVSIKNARVEIVKNNKGGGREVVQVSGFGLTLDQIQNGQPSQLNYEGNLFFERTAGSQTNLTQAEAAAAGLIQAKYAGNFAIRFSPSLAPESINGKSRLDVTKAGGAMSNLAALATALDCDLTPTEIRKANVRFEQSGNTLGELRASGPFSATTMEGRIKVELASIDRRLLNLAGASTGIDFNKTAINSSNEIELKQKGTIIGVNGQFNIVDFSMTQKAKNQTTPAITLAAAYQVNVDQNNKSALIQKLDLNGTENQKNFLRAALSKPMPISWGAGSGVPEEAALDLFITSFNLADWQSFAADMAPAGLLDSTLHVVSRAGGKQLDVDLTSKLTDFSARFGSNQISQAGIDLSTKLQVQDMKKVNLNNYRFQLAQNGSPALSVTGSGNVDLDTKETNVKTVLDAQIPQVLQIVKIPDVAAKSGSVRFDGQIVQGKEGQKVTGTLALGNLSGTFTKYVLDRLEAKFDADLAVMNDNLEIRKLTGTLSQSGLPGGSIDVGGALNTKTKAGQVALKMADINQNFLRPFIAPALSGKQLASISINANASATMEAGGAATLKGDLGITNLVVRATNQLSLPAPLSAQFKLDGTLQQQKQQLDLRQLQITLSPTERAKNQIDIKGQADFSKTNALVANLSVQAESVDVTPFYDLATGGAKPAEAQSQPTAQPQAAPAAAPAKTEPEPVQLPIQQASVTLNIGRFYLRQIEITNWQSTVKVEGSHVMVNPFQLTLNGAPVSSAIDMDLGVKGYKYQVNLSMDKVPVEPFVTSFAPEKAGTYKGFLLANTAIKGAGITDPNVAKNLSGQASFSLTNAAVKLVGGWLPTLLQPIAIALKVPEILSDPLNSITGSLTAGEGKMNVQTFNLKSAAFVADIHGDIQLSNVLTNSPLNLPMTFSLKREYVKNVPFFAALAETNATYVALPDFVKVGGTLGKPKTEVSLSKEGAISVLKGIGGQVGGSDTKKIIGGIGGILGGQSPQPSTNAPGTNAAPQQPGAGVNQLLNNLFNKPKK